MIEEAKRELLNLFGGVSSLRAWEGLWKDEGEEYFDEHILLRVDVPDEESDWQTMRRVKEHLRELFGQKELYVTTSLVEII